MDVELVESDEARLRIVVTCVLGDFSILRDALRDVEEVPSGVLDLEGLWVILVPAEAGVLNLPATGQVMSEETSIHTKLDEALIECSFTPKQLRDPAEGPDLYRDELKDQ